MVSSLLTTFHLGSQSSGPCNGAGDAGPVTLAGLHSVVGWLV